MKVSLVMATYNGESFLVEQLDSIKNQTRKIDEVIICDDGSSDSTQELVRRYIANNNLQNWNFEINKKNEGYSANFSNMLKMTSGDVIFLADQDDVWYLDKIEKMCEAMERQKDALLIASNLEPLYMSDEAPKLSYEEFYGEGKLIKIGFSGRWIKPIRPGCSFAIRKDIFNYYSEVWNKKYPHDCILWNLACLFDKAYLLNSSTMKYRRHANNASNLGKHNMNYRIKCVQDEITIMNTFVSNIDIVNSKIKFINKQITIYENRLQNLRTKSILGCIKALINIKYFGRGRFWLTDLYYIIRY